VPPAEVDAAGEAADDGQRCEHEEHQRRRLNAIPLVAIR
jgi:hypothetical protein